MRLNLLLISWLFFVTWACSSKSSDYLSADRVLVYKSQRTLHLLKNGISIKTYRIALGANPVGLKQRQGDEKTPAGIYRLDWRNSASHYYKSIHFSYPDAAEKARAKQLGVSLVGVVNDFEDTNGRSGN
jgi:murein L,D-transpeptidase YafK